MVIYVYIYIYMYIYIYSSMICWTVGSAGREVGDDTRFDHPAINAGLVTFDCFQNATKRANSPVRPLIMRI